MQMILNRAAMKSGVHPSFLEFHAVQDESRTMGKILYLFHIEDPAHPKYESTVSIVRAA